MFQKHPWESYRIWLREKQQSCGPETRCFPGGIWVLQCLGRRSGSPEAWEGVRAVLLSGSPSSSISLLQTNLRVLKGKVTLKPDPPVIQLGSTPRVSVDIPAPYKFPPSKHWILYTLVNQQSVTNSYLSKLRSQNKNLWNLNTSFYKFMRKISNFCPISILATKFKMFIWEIISYSSNKGQEDGNMPKRTFFYYKFQCGYFSRRGCVREHCHIMDTSGTLISF